MKTAREVYYDIHDIVQRRIAQHVEDAAYTYKSMPVVMIWNNGIEIIVQVRTHDGKQEDHSVKPNSEWID